MTILDFSTLFDTVDHNILYRRLTTEYRVEGIALDWFNNWIIGYLSNRSSNVKINDPISDAHSPAFWVPFKLYFKLNI